MFEFIKKIQEFLAGKFATDEDIDTQIAVNDEYMFNHELGNTEVQVGLLDNSEYDQGTTFEGEQVTYVPIQFTVYATQMKIGGKMRNPRDVSVIMADKICRYMRTCVRDVDDVILCTRTDYSASYPMNDGATRYFVALRYDLAIKCPYRG